MLTMRVVEVGYQSLSSIQYSTVLPKVDTWLDKIDISRELQLNLYNSYRVCESLITKLLFYWA